MSSKFGVQSGTPLQVHCATVVCPAWPRHHAGEGGEMEAEEAKGQCSDSRHYNSCQICCQTQQVSLCGPHTSPVRQKLSTVSAQILHEGAGHTTTHTSTVFMPGPDALPLNPARQRCMNAAHTTTTTTKLEPTQQHSINHSTRVSDALCRAGQHTMPWLLHQAAFATVQPAESANTQKKPMRKDT